MTTVTTASGHSSTLNDETRSMLAHSVRQFTDSAYSFDQRRENLKQHQGQSAGHWATFAEMGWLGIPFSEEQGGLGGDITDTLDVVRGFGRALVTEPYLAVVGQAGGLLAGSTNHSLRERLLPGLISGERQLIFAGEEAGSRGNPHQVNLAVEKDGSGFRLSGEKQAVVYSQHATEVIVSARSSGANPSSTGLDLFVVPLDIPGVEVSAYATIDGHQGARIRFEGVSVSAGQRLTDAGQAGDLISRVNSQVILMMTAEALGMMDVLIRKTATYLKTRKQFGVALAEFQVLQHRLTDMYVEATATDNLFRQMVGRLRAANPDTTALAAMASRLKARMGQSGRYVGQQAIQLHGGIGMTDELDIGHYFKRLTALEVLQGGTEFHLKLIWQQLNNE